MIELVIAALIQLGTLTADGSTPTTAQAASQETTTTTTDGDGDGGTGTWDDGN